MEEWINRAWGAALVAGPVLATAWLWVRTQTRQLKADADAERLERGKAEAELRKLRLDGDEQEAKVTDAEARAITRRKQEESDWAVKQAREMLEDMRRQMVMALFKMDRAIRQRTRCQVLVATLIAELRQFRRKLRVPEDGGEMDAWIQEVLNPKSDPEPDSDADVNRPDPHADS